MIQSEMFLQVSLRSTTVRAEATFVLVLFMMQLVVGDDWAVVLDRLVVAWSDHPDSVGCWPRVISSSSSSDQGDNEYQ